LRVYRRGKRGTWWVEFRDPVSGREIRRSLRVTQHRAADRLAFELVEQLARRYHRLATRKPWEEAVDAYLAHGEIHKEAATVSEDRRTMKGAKARGGRPARPPRFQPPPIVRFVDDVRTEHVEAYVVARKVLGRSHSRINRELRTLRAFFNYSAAPSRRWITENPAREVPMLSEPQGTAARALDDETLAKILQAVEGTRLEGPVLLALNHGLREGELVHLRRDAVESDHGRLWIRHDPLTGWKVKGGRERVVYFNEVTQRWLSRHLAWPGPELCPYLFVMKLGRPWTREALCVGIGRVMRRIGVARGGLHMLRHTWATRQAEAGTPVPVLKDMGGWRDWRSMAAYQHVGDEAQRQAAQRVAFGPRHAKVIALRLPQGGRSRGEG